VYGEAGRGKAATGRSVPQTGRYAECVRPPERVDEPSIVRRSYRSHRLEALSDGVFAIALGLLVPLVAIFGYLVIAVFFLVPFPLRR
jgi:hypothetical protein